MLSMLLNVLLSSKTVRSKVLVSRIIPMRLSARLWSDSEFRANTRRLLVGLHDGHFFVSRVE
jgi:hypothetical protein